MKGKKIGLFIIVLIAIGIVGFSGWYLGGKYKNKDEAKKEAEKIEIKDIVVKYRTETYSNSTEDKRITINNKLVIPESISIDSGKKIVDYMEKTRKDSWIELKTDTDDIVNEYDADFQFEDTYGVEYITTHEVFEKVIVFTNTTSGGMGGVGWNDVEIYNFNIKTGSILKIKDICKDVNECKSFMKRYFMNTLAKDERFTDLVPDYEVKIDEYIYKEGYYGFTKDGFVLIVPKYALSDGANNSFEYVIPYKEMNEYLVSEYQM